MSYAVDQLQKIEVYLFSALSAVYAWYFSTAPSKASDVTGEGVGFENFQYVLWIPPGLAFLALYRSQMQLRYIETLAEYLSMLECQLSRSGSDCSWPYTGWETWYKIKGPRAWNVRFRMYFWTVMIAVTCSVPFAI
ncbi:hypothetical protein RA20_03310 [Leisingera sp. ANG-Vp]|nr:hypothetical protein RA20_03310 [Leisingera sp. ANG-Vp]